MSRVIDMKKYKLFVYGTLKKGFHNHDFLKYASYLGERTIKGKMYSYGAFPYVNIKQNGIIHGELYSIDENTLLDCDSLEGYPSFYSKKEVITNKNEKVLVYYINKECNALIKNGVW